MWQNITSNLWYFLSFYISQDGVHVFAESFTGVSKKQAYTELGSPHDLDQLIQMFPSHEVTFLKEVLDKCGSINDAVAEIVGDHETSNDGM